MGEIAGKVLGILAVIALGLVVFVNINQGVELKTTNVIAELNNTSISTP